MLFLYADAKRERLLFGAFNSIKCFPTASPNPSFSPAASFMILFIPSQVSSAIPKEPSSKADATSSDVFPNFAISKS